MNSNRNPYIYRADEEYLFQFCNEELELVAVPVKMRPVNFVILRGGEGGGGGRRGNIINRKALKYL